MSASRARRFTRLASDPLAVPAGTDPASLASTGRCSTIELRDHDWFIERSTKALWMAHIVEHPEMSPCALHEWAQFSFFHACIRARELSTRKRSEKKVGGWRRSRTLALRAPPAVFKTACAPLHWRHPCWRRRSESNGLIEPLQGPAFPICYVVKRVTTEFFTSNDVEKQLVGALGGSQTRDLPRRRRTLCSLSYERMEPTIGIEPIACWLRNSRSAK
jgi:hypothetical protein